jgi:hypothetical protein
MNINNFQKFSATGMKLLPQVLETKITPKIFPFKRPNFGWRNHLAAGTLAALPVAGAAHLWEQHNKENQSDANNSSDTFNKIMQFADGNPWAYYAAPAAVLGGVGGLFGGSGGALAGLALGALGGYGLKYLRDNPDVFDSAKSLVSSDKNTSNT